MSSDRLPWDDDDCFSSVDDTAENTSKAVDLLRDLKGDVETIADSLRPAHDQALEAANAQLKKLEEIRSGLSTVKWLLLGILLTLLWKFA